MAKREVEHVKRIDISVFFNNMSFNVYTDENVSELSAEDYVKRNYDKYYRQLISNMILSGEIKINYNCSDCDGGYFVEDDDIVPIEEFRNIKDDRDEYVR